MLTGITMPAQLRAAVVKKLMAKQDIESEKNAKRVGTMLDADIELNERRLGPPTC